MSLILSSLQPLIKDFLQTHPSLVHFPIVTEDEMDILKQIDAALAGLLAGPTGKVGCSIFISTLVGRSPVPNNPGTYFESIGIIIEVVEQRRINRDATHSPTATLTPGLEVAEMIAAIMKNFGTSEITPSPSFWEQDDTIGPPEVDERTGAVTHTVRLWCHGGNRDSTEACGDPQVSSAGSPTATVTIVHGTNANRTLYTTDGTRPAYFGDGNANNVGSVYSLPFQVAAGTTVLARSFHSGLSYRGSLIVTTTA